MHRVADGMASRSRWSQLSLYQASLVCISYAIGSIGRVKWLYVSPQSILCHEVVLPRLSVRGIEHDVPDQHFIQASHQ